MTTEQHPPAAAESPAEAPERPRQPGAVERRKFLKTVEIGTAHV